MKMKFLPIALILAGMMYPSSSQAQITIEKSDYVMVSTPEYRQTYVLVDNYLNYKTPKGGTDQVWLYQDQSATFLADFNYYQASDAFFTNALHYEAARLELSAFGVPTDFYYRLDNNGYTEFAKEQHDSTMSLEDITGTPGDQVHFGPDKQLYTGQNSHIVFPLTYGKQWTDDYSRTTPFDITVSAYGLTNTPGYHKHIAKHENEVTGSGKLYMSYKQYTADTMEVLLVKNTITYVDSFYLGGNPAPDQLLSALGLQQGLTTTYTKYTFFRKGYGDVLLELNSDFNTPGSSVTKMYCNVDGIKGINLSVSPIASDYTATKLYPNPASAHSTIQVVLPSEANQPANYRMLDIQGKEVQSQIPFTQSGTQVSMNLPSKAQNGVYLLQALDATGTVLFQRKVILHP